MSELTPEAVPVEPVERIVAPAATPAPVEAAPAPQAAPAEDADLHGGQDY